jgi:hypothetical protein
MTSQGLRVESFFLAHFSADIIIHLVGLTLRKDLAS